MDNPILIASCGDTFPSIRSRYGNFDLWFLDAFEEVGARAIVWNVHRELAAPEIDFSGILITGSPAMVTDRAKWSESLGSWLKIQEGKDIPVLGVCYGHQLLADVWGGRVDYQPDGREIGSLLVSLSEDAKHDQLFGSLPKSFYVHLTHAQSVIFPPPGAVILAKSSRVGCQAFKLGKTVWGVQFHPEFSKEVMACYLDEYKSQIPPGFRLQLQNHLHDCTEARSILHEFARICLHRQS